MITRMIRPKRRVRESAQARLLVVDDHPLVRSGFVDLLSSEPDLDVCGEAAEEEEALELALILEPDLMIVDVELDSGSGVELCRRVAALDLGIRIIAVSSHGPLYAARLLRAGAHGFIGKRQPVDVLLDGVRTVLQGGFFVCEASQHDFSSALEAVCTSSNLSRLSDRELDVFHYLGRGFTTREIAEALGLSPKTIESYLESTKAKLGLESAQELACCANQWLLSS